MRKLLIIPIMLAILTACQPTPTPKTIDILGDSLTQQAYWNRDAAFLAQGQPPGSDVVFDAWMGNQFHDVQAAETARVNDTEQPRPAIMVIALGTNNALGWTGYWTTSDQQDYDKLLNTPHATTCVVVVLPGFSYKPSIEQKAQEQVSKARSYMKTQALARPKTVVADWGAIARAHPEYTTDDGIHLVDTDAVKNLYAKTIWDGVNSCPA